MAPRRRATSYPPTLVPTTLPSPPPPAVLPPKGQAWWAWRAWSWESKAASALVTLALIFSAVLLQPSDSTRVTRALSTMTLVPAPTVPFVERREMAVIVDAVALGNSYVIVDGGNRVGKSVAVEVAMSRLSQSHSVFAYSCEEGSTASVVLRGLFNLDGGQAGWFARTLGAYVKLPENPPISSSDIKGVLLRARPYLPEPVFVVEMAERLEVKELKALFDLAKEIVDKRRGRFIFVFSPSDKLHDILDFGSVSRARVVHVGDLTADEAKEVLAGSGCDSDRALELFALVGGHLPDLVSDHVGDFCRGYGSLPGVEAALTAAVNVKLTRVDEAFGSGAACAGLCSTVANDVPSILDNSERKRRLEIIFALVQKHLVVASLTLGRHIDSKFLRTFISEQCSCTK